MPAVTPADVQTLPSRTKMRSRFHRVCGWFRLSRSHADQCVVARLPSSSPAAASTNAPVHTDVTRRLRRASVGDRLHELGVAGRGERALPAHDDEGVDRAPDRGERPVGDDPRAPHRHDRAGLGGGDLDVVAAGRAEHLVRPDQVERGDAGIGDEHDSAAHAAHSAASARMAAMTFSGRFLPRAGPPRRAGAAAARCYKVAMTERTYRLISGDSHVNEPRRPLDRRGCPASSATGRPASTASTRATRGCSKACATRSTSA